MSIDKEAIRARWKEGRATWQEFGFLLDALDERDRQRDAVLALHPVVIATDPMGDSKGYRICETCDEPAPCGTARALGVDE